MDQSYDSPDSKSVAASASRALTLGHRELRCRARRACRAGPAAYSSRRHAGGGAAPPFPFPLPLSIFFFFHPPGGGAGLAPCPPPAAAAIAASLSSRFRFHPGFDLPPSASECGPEDFSAVFSRLFRAMSDGTCGKVR